MIFLFSYTTIGIHRICFGGINVFTSGRILYWIVDNTYNASYDELGLGKWLFDVPLLKEFFLLGFPIITLFEILAPLVLLNPLFRACFLLIIYPFHLMNWLFMDLLLLESMLLLILLFDISRWLKPTLSELRPIIFYDGVCGLCDKFVQWMLKQDPEGIFMFAPLQGQTATQTLGTNLHNELKSIVFYDQKKRKAYKRSTAVVRILFGLGGLWKILGILLWLIPLPLRNLGYDLVAANRYEWFGKYDVCRLPTIAQTARFLP